MKQNLITRTLLSLCLLLVTSLAQADYANINGISLYYETHGQGTPVVMLHGGYADSDMWLIETWLLSYHYKVIEIDSRGHGRSTDGNIPITYEQMTDDTLDLLDQLNITNAHFVGWSDGAVIASQIAASHPERVNQMVMFGAAYQNDVYIDAFSFLLNDVNIFNAFVDISFGIKYKKINPNPNHWTVFRDKLHDLWQSPCYFANAPEGHCLEALQNITAPTLVVAGEAEIIKRTHTQDIVDSIPGAELKIVPHAGHFLPELRPFKAAKIILNFLNN